LAASVVAGLGSPPLAETCCKRAGAAGAKTMTFEIPRGTTTILRGAQLFDGAAGHGHLLQFFSGEEPDLRAVWRPERHVRVLGAVECFGGQRIERTDP
jgi:hypothetical protein